MPVNRLRIIISCSKVKKKINKYNYIINYSKSYESDERGPRSRNQNQTECVYKIVYIGQTPRIDLHPTFPQDNTNLIIYNLI